MKFPLPKIPLATWVTAIVNWIVKEIGPFLSAISDFIRVIVNHVISFLDWVPPYVLILVFAILAYRAGKWKLALGTVLGLLLIWDLNLWKDMIITLVLVLISSLVSVLIGLPLGIWSARRERVYRVVSPILDLMQTMPSFVYLIPVIMLFNIGLVPAIIATVIFAMPPTIRLTRLGILHVPGELVEASRAFGTNDSQLLWKVQVPLATPNIKAGINQTIMLALSMVVIASMIGAGGLGSDVMSALQTINVGQGFEAGICIVILAIVMDRISQKFGGKRTTASE
ncbi:ABC transporter permease [Alicyclobacillus dauci]|uniref:Proline/glycine betaine ABC transporter permease n=1 Tax=Alicyclobacillus dauci TaxID=1475485 RepID=A0ABY6Z0W1_9BACL|nr:proline/glycine betaine ABC transporter permease [Alicyclobacillus dauci]WAH36510.1 proline/glycine betaine ABC transporter permease [Alicyclobacillus dauci]